MKKFTKITAIAASLPIDNVDTDMIIPKQFLTTVKRTGLGENLFFEMRYDEKNNKIEDFILHHEPFTKAKILLSGDNFGCGSSREHAPWALADFGIECVMAESFADIFYNNMFQNGLLPIILPKEDIQKLTDYAKKGQEITVDLENTSITYGEKTIEFSLEEARKNALLNGESEIKNTLKHISEIKSFEEKMKEDYPWL